MARPKRKPKAEPWQPEFFGRPWCADQYDVGDRVALSHGYLVVLVGPANAGANPIAPYRADIVICDDGDNPSTAEHFRIFFHGMEQLRMTDADLCRALKLMLTAPDGHGAAFMPGNWPKIGHVDGVVREFVEDGAIHKGVILSPGMMPSPKGWT